MEYDHGVIPHFKPLRAGLSAVIAAALAFVLLGLTGCSLLPFPPCGQTSDGAADQAGGTGEGRPVQDKIQPVPTAIVLDASGSMKAEDAPGQRFAAAKRAVHGLIEKIPEGQSTALLTYGTGTSNADSAQAKGCKDVTTLLKAKAIDKRAFDAKVDGIKPSGYTPIALALQTAAKELPDSGERSIVLLSDGIDTCADQGERLNPCTVAKDLGADGGLHIHTVGFRVDGRTSRQLSCLSEATQGTSWDAVNDAQLTTRLAATLNPGLTSKQLTPDGYGGLRPGMSADQAKQAADFDEDVAGSGRVEIVWRDCTLVFVDGKLSEIITDKATTLDGVKVGDDISAAEKLYKDPDLPTPVADGAATYAADPINGLGYRMYFDGADSHQAGQKPSGTITKIVLCLCGTTDSYSVAPPPVSIFPGCTIADKCRVTDAIQVQHPSKGALTLAMVARSNTGPAGEPYGSYGAIYVVDSAGKVMTTEGQVAGVDPGDTGSAMESFSPLDEVAEDFRFMRPATDRSGWIFGKPLHLDGTQALSLKMEEDGYFTRTDSTVIDWDQIPFEGEADMDWDGIDSRGYYRIKVVAKEENPQTYIWHRKGDGYVLEN